MVKAFAFQADGLGFISSSGYEVGRPGHSKYVRVGHYEPSCLKIPSSVLEDKLYQTKPKNQTCAADNICMSEFMVNQIVSHTCGY